VELRGKTAIVTGAAVRLGRAIALALADAGANVCVHYHRSADQARRTCEEITARGVSAALVQADLRDPVTAATTIFGAACERFSQVDVLVNSAAIFEPETWTEATAEQWERCFAINLQAPFWLCREFAARLSSEQTAHIVNIADRRASRPGTDHPIYTLTKSGLLTLTEILARELAPDVQVNAVAPGAILPPPGEEDSYLERVARGVPLGRRGSPRDVAEAVLFLLRSDFITGETVHVAGGEQL